MKVEIGRYPIGEEEQRNINVKIENFDTWNMDATLALIIVPMLKQLKEQKQGAPNVDEEDVPESLWANRDEIQHEGDIDSNWFKRWDYIIDEMIWSFEQCTIDWESQYYEYGDDPGDFGLKITKSDDDGRKAHEKRMSNGFKLFGKYYRCLWT